MWDELCLRYQEGLDSLRWMQKEWEKTEGKIDEERFEKVKSLLVMQERDAKIWKDACILYFQTFSGRPVPAGVEKPEHDLAFYRNYRYTDIPGISR